MMANFLEFCRGQFENMNPMPQDMSSGPALKGMDRPINQMHPLVLAYVGDAVYELYIRVFALRHEIKVRHLHKMVTGLVKASTQAAILKGIETQLTEEEQIAAKRGRNAKTGHTPKNATVVDYRLATGFEALLGYLFFTGDNDRLTEILSMAVTQGQRIIKSPEK